MMSPYRKRSRRRAIFSAFLATAYLYFLFFNRASTSTGRANNGIIKESNNNKKQRDDGNDEIFSQQGAQHSSRRGEYIWRPPVEVAPAARQLLSEKKPLWERCDFESVNMPGLFVALYVFVMFDIFLVSVVQS